MLTSPSDENKTQQYCANIVIARNQCKTEFLFHIPYTFKQDRYYLLINLAFTGFWGDNFGLASTWHWIVKS